MKKKMSLILILAVTALLLSLETGATYGGWSSGLFNIRFNTNRTFYLPELGAGNYQLWIRASNPEVCVMFNGGETKAPTPGRFLPGGYRNISLSVMSGGSQNFSVYSGNRVSGAKVTVCYGCCRKTVYGQRYPDASVEVGVSR